MVLQGLLCTTQHCTPSHKCCFMLLVAPSTKQTHSKLWNASLATASGHCRLKLRELLMPQVVSQVEGSNPNVRTAKSNGYRSWKVNPDLFPCDLSQPLQKQADAAVQVRHHSFIHFARIVVPSLLLPPPPLCMCSYQTPESKQIQQRKLKSSSACVTQQHLPTCLCRKGRPFSHLREISQSLQKQANAAVRVKLHPPSCLHASRASAGMHVQKRKPLATCIGSRYLSNSKQMLWLLVLEAHRGICC